MLSCRAESAEAAAVFVAFLNTEKEFEKEIESCFRRARLRRSRSPHGGQVRRRLLQGDT